MFPFWDLVIAPIIDAVGAKRVVEIGALRGENTVQMLEHLAADAELHVIDPVPAFDPAEHEEQFPGRYIFHRDLSLNALPHIAAVDVALIDGDHNWYTVYYELKQIAETAREAGAPMPVMLLHDVGWPYGRRDLYYGPDEIPVEFRQPYAQMGIRPGEPDVLEVGGLNPTMNNALREGGPRNGVMTAVDDFVEESDEPLRLLVLPIYFGLAIVASEARIAAEPELARVLDHLESREGRYELMKLAEATRIKAMLFQHNVYYHRERLLAAGTRRYLDLLKGALLDEHHLENELRINYLATCIAKGWEPSGEIIRDPVRQMKDKNRRLRAARRSGQLRDETGQVGAYFPHTTMGRVRLDHLERCLDQVRSDGVPGDVLEVGTGRGGGSIFMRGYLEIWNVRGRKVFVADEFRADVAADVPPAGEPTGSVPAPDAAAPTAACSPGELALGWTDPSEMMPGGGPGFPSLGTDLNQVREAFKAFDLFDIGVRFLQGRPAETLPDAPFEQLALVRIGTGLGDAVVEALDAVIDRVSPGGFVIVDDYSTPEVRKAVDEWRARRGIDDLVERIDWSGAFWRVADPVDVLPGPAILKAATAAVVADRAPLAPDEAVTRPCDLSVVVVFYNMRREAERTLHSLSRSYQRGIDDLDYEVIVVENGSEPDQKVGEDLVRSFGPEFRYLDLGDEAQPSPAHALNRGMAVAGGTSICFMIDGAHVLTPGVLRYGMAGLRTYEPAVVGTQLWYVGPGQQGDAMLDGYDQDFEDRLFDEVSWPVDGYRLFDIGQFVGDRDWFDGLWESNCFFVPRELAAQIGGFDESFSVAGGGYTNLDLYERFTATPGVSVATILGEGSFHQIHGGTTTNQASIDERRRRITSYAEDYAEMRGRNFRGAHKTMHYVGTMFHEACRTKPRRRTAAHIFREGVPGDPDGMPETSSPVPEDLAVEFTDAYWRSLRWQSSTWLGHTIGRPPTDLFAYQEILSQVRPDWILETGTGNGGRALYLASICELLGRGRVISIDTKTSSKRPAHPRITYLTGMAFDDAVLERIRELTGGTTNALAILGTHSRRLRMMTEFEAFKPFIAIGSYIIVEDTILNGHPVYPTFGPGPHEAAKQLLGRHHDFVADTTVEKQVLTFNPAGYLRRIG